MWDIPDVSDPARRGKNLGYIYGGGFFRIPNLYQWRTGRGSGGSLRKNLYGSGHEPCFYVSGIRGCGDCHSSSRQKPYQIRNPDYSGFGISGPCKHTERTAGTRKRLCHCVLYLYHVWDSYGTCQNQDKRICYF